MPNNSYIGAVQIESGDQILVGSTLFGVCDTAANTAAKVVTLASFDQLLNGVTVQVKFTSGNTVTTNVTLKINTTDALPVTGNCVCEANQVIAFTFENVSGTRYWRSHHNISGAMPISGGTFTGAVTLAGAPTTANGAATKAYVDSMIPSLEGLVGAMHFKGVSTTAITDGGTENPTIGGTVVTTKVAGDVVIYGDQEYVWSTTNKWELLGDEGSYALKSKTDKAIKSLGFTANTQPSLTITETTIPNVTNAGSAPQLTVTETSIPNVTSAGSVTTAEVTNGT